MKLMSKWRVDLEIGDGYPCTTYDWNGDADSREDAIRKARAAYPDPIASYRIRYVGVSARDKGYDD